RVHIRLPARNAGDGGGAHLGTLGKLSEGRFSHLPSNLPVGREMRYQKASFRASWTVRGERALVMRPKVESETVVSGLFSCVWLNALKNSPRSCSRRFSRIAITRWAPRSTLKVPGPIRVLRPTFPKLLSAGTPKQFVVNQRAMRSPRDPLVYCGLQSNWA